MEYRPCHFGAGKRSTGIARSSILLRVSESFSYVLAYQIGSNPTVSDNGGIPIGSVSKWNKSTEIIPSAVITVQFAILEAFEFDAFLDFKIRNKLADDHQHVKRYERRPVESRMESLSALTGLDQDERLTNAYASVASFRNVLTHEPEYLCNSTNVAFDIYSLCQGIGYKIALLTGVPTPSSRIQHRIELWQESIERFDSIVDLS